MAGLGEAWRGWARQGKASFESLGADQVEIDRGKNSERQGKNAPLEANAALRGN